MRARILAFSDRIGRSAKRFRTLEPGRAAQELRKLRSQAESPEIQREGSEHEAWKAKVDAVMQGGLDRDSETLRRFRAVSYHLGIRIGALGEALRDARFFAERVQDAAAFIDAAIYELSGIPKVLLVTGVTRRRR